MNSLVRWLERPGGYYSNPIDGRGEVPSFNGHKLCVDTVENCFNNVAIAG